ncbi:hypothetical protein HA51_04840 [Pantoea rwandensis]|uniref:HTH araC/xylS-type domain-containing protein n=2 Tax=Pantoea rwandensis TaxID=1076550 RepID=A0A1X1D3F6_9GAMM|nr:hypothetical protein HA51_04840 [Pantoea rwandensis]
MQVKSCSEEVVAALLVKIETDIKEDLSIEELCKFTGYSPGHLQRLFKSKTSLPLATFIRNRKIYHAAQSIIGSKKRILDVAVDYSYSSHQSFSRAFKAVIGITPVQFKQANDSQYTTLLSAHYPLLLTLSAQSV